ncbi:MAG: low temperature requirement protein A [Actinobacteria bacterium]|nr:MAG: low temperature requirement protein A [Actinomycetota bacterium]
MSDRRDERTHRVTPLELFFDLVFVFAITQVTTFLARTPTGGGLVRGVLLLAALWWAWSAYAWLTNALDPEEGAVRLAVLTAVAAMLIVSLAAPRAFGRDGVIFGLAYLVVRVLHVVLFGIASRGDRDMRHAVLRISATAPAPALLVVAGALHGAAQLVLWGVALTILYGSPLIGHMRGMRVSPEHFVERFGLIIIIALGESIVAIGVGASGLKLDAGVITAALLGVTVAACLWWSYFDWAIYATQARLAEAEGSRRSELARDVYSYLHLPMVAGIVLFAFGLKTTLPLADKEIALGTIPAIGLCGGLALYFLAHVAVRLRLEGGLGRGRPIATVVLLGMIPVATNVPALGALAVVTAICVVLIAYEVLRHRTSRAWIRDHRGADFTLDEVRQVAEPERRPRRARRRR